MSKWSIDKTFNFEMGHRVWSQRLNNPELSITTDCACKHLHGHSYAIKVFLTANQLDQSAMVTDFKNLNFMKRFVDEALDHKFMIDINDPHFPLITGVTVEGHDEQIRPEFVAVKAGTVGNLGKLMPSDSEATQLHRDSFVLVNFVPTSENICKYLFKVVKESIGDLAKVSAVELWETKKSHCRYEE